MDGCDGRSISTLMAQKASANVVGLPAMVSKWARSYMRVMEWRVKQLETPMPAGMKAMIFRRYILVSRTLNFGLKGIVDKTTVFQLLQRALSDPRTVELSDPRIVRSSHEGVGFPLECLHIVKFLLRLRDSLILRVQLRVELGDRGAFIAELELSFESRMDEVEKSLCMLSYRKVVWEKFADAFESNSKMDNDLRTRPRPPKKGGRRQPASAPVHRFPPGLEDECRRLMIEQYWAEFLKVKDMELGNVDEETGIE